ncbi:MAG: protein-L-isoaspartate O-methyltransferase [Nanoarchaeota archaeon]
MNKSELIEQLKRMGFSEKILEAFSLIKREKFVSEELQKKAYDDTALPIGHGQTISQPYTIALMLSELDLKEGQKILEIGSGSGYVLVLLSYILGQKSKIFGLEVIKQLAKKSKENLEDYGNIKIYNKNGFNGLPDEAPFDRILISAAAREIPKKILNQLKDGGILVAPKGPVFEQNIVVIQRQGDKFVTKTEIPGFVFVPFVEG